MIPKSIEGATGSFKRTIKLTGLSELLELEHDNRWAETRYFSFSVQHAIGAQVSQPHFLSSLRSVDLILESTRTQYQVWCAWNRRI